MPKGTDSEVLTTHTACVHCNQNLRGLCRSDPCPRCGRPVEDTLRSPHGIRVAAAVRAAAEAAGSTEGAIDFVFQALSRVGQPRDPGHVTAAALCLEVRRLAEASFESAEEARERMTAWRMRSSEELGRIVYALIDFGVLCASADDKPEDFNGLFTLDEWFPVTSPT